MRRSERVGVLVILVSVHVAVVPRVAMRVAVGGARVMALAIGASGSFEAAIDRLEGTPVWSGTVMSIAAPYR